METIKYVIQDNMGLHARPAGRIVKMAASFAGKVEVGTPAKMVDGKRIMGIMGLQLKKGDEMMIKFEGEGAAQAAAEMNHYLKENL